jgi:hypothetical protein
LRNKQSYLQSVLQSLEAFEIYKKTEFPVLLAQKKEQERKAEEAQAATEAPAAIFHKVEESK